MTDLQRRLSDEADPGKRLEMIDRALRPPEPQLLDTCVLQNLDWIDRLLERTGSVTWDDAAIANLEHEYGTPLAQDLLDLGILYKTFEHHGGYPWLVCEAAIAEADALKGPKGRRLRELIEFLVGHQEDWSNDCYPGIAQGLLLGRDPGRVSPLILKALGVDSIDTLREPSGPLGFLSDLGDRLVASQALVSNIPAILTTDRRTFWRERERLAELGVLVIRPSELLKLYEPYWEVLETEFACRRTSVRSLVGC